MLRPPVESALGASVGFADRLTEAGVTPSLGRTGVCGDNATIKATWATVKREVRHIHGDRTIPPDHSSARSPSTTSKPSTTANDTKPVPVTAPPPRPTPPPPSRPEIMETRVHQTGATPQGSDPAQYPVRLTCWMPWPSHISLIRLNPEPVQQTMTRDSAIGWRRRAEVRIGRRDLRPTPATRSRRHEVQHVVGLQPARR